MFSQACVIPSVHSEGWGVCFPACITGHMTRGLVCIQWVCIWGSASRGVCSQGGLHLRGLADPQVYLWGGGVAQPATPLKHMGYYGIRSTRGRYASYWNSFLLLQSETDINYPAFFSSQPDEVFVQTEIVSFLEKRGFRICYHLRDFIPGTLIANNIEDATETSRRMIFIVSRFECSVCLGNTIIFTHYLECQVCLIDVLLVCCGKNDMVISPYAPGSATHIFFQNLCSVKLVHEGVSRGACARNRKWEKQISDSNKTRQCQFRGV